MTAEDDLGPRELPWATAVGRTAGANLIVTLAASLTGILLARWLGPTGRGEYAAVTAYFGLMLIITELGIESSLVFFVAKRRQAADDFVRTASALYVPLGLLSASVTVGVATAVLGADDPRRTPLLVVTICTTVCLVGAPRMFALQALSIAHWNVVRVSQPVVMMVLTVIWHLLRPLDVTAVVCLLAVSLAVQTIWSWFLYSRQRMTRGRFRPDAVRPMVAYGLSSVASKIPNSMNARLDQLVLAILVAPAMLGQYAVAVTLSTLAAPLAIAFGYVSFPKLAGGHEIRDTILRTIRGSFVVSILGVGAIALCAPLIVPVVFGQAYDEVVDLVYLLAPGAVFFAANQVFADLLLGLGRPNVVARYEWAGLACTVLGLYALVPTMGVYGAAIASSVAYLSVSVLLWSGLRNAIR